MKLSRTQRRELKEKKQNKILQKKMEEITPFVDINSPQWFICKGCKYFSCDEIYGVCLLGCKNPNGTLGTGARQWILEKDTPKALYNCPKKIYHTTYNILIK